MWNNSSLETLPSASQGLNLETQLQLLSRELMPRVVGLEQMHILHITHIHAFMYTCSYVIIQDTCVHVV